MIGELRHRITLQKPIISTNPNGFEVVDWQDLKKVWAAVSNLRGREYYAAATVQAENTVKFIIRYIPDIDNSMRIIFKGKYYNITAIDNLKYQNKYVEIKGLEVV